MLMQGPRRMCRPAARVSSPSASPTWYTSSGFQVEAIEISVGKHVDFTPQPTPCGPSVTLSDGMPSRGKSIVSPLSFPESKSIFSSSVMRESRSSTRCSTGSFEFLYGSVSCEVDVFVMIVIVRIAIG